MDKGRLPRVSLPAQFDDLVRNMKALSKGIEPEFKEFVVAQSKWVQKLKQSEYGLRKTKDKISSLESENKSSHTKIKHLNSLLDDAISARKRAEAERDSLANQIRIIKDVLLHDPATDQKIKQKLVSLSSTCKLDTPPRLHTIEESMQSLFSPSDIDQTDYNVDLNRSGSKRRSSGRRSSNKKKKLEMEQEKFFPIIKKKLEISSSSDNRSTSEQAGSSPEALAYQNHETDSEQPNQCPYNLRRSDTDCPSLGTPIGVKKVRYHVFVPKKKTEMNSVKCNACGQNTAYLLQQILKCENCKIVCHPKCKEKCSAPCFPIINTPTKGIPGTIADYTPSTSPMIPSLIVHCVNEIESRGLKDVSLYSTPDNQSDIKNLKERFIPGRGVPCLSDVNVSTLCGAVKEFLSSLKEPLITYSAWQSFVDAAEMKNEALSSNAVYDTARNLPQPNRDTLAFLILHLQNIIESPGAKMSLGKLSKLFGPIIVGYSEPEPDQMNMMLETRQQNSVMTRLLSIPSDSWQNMLNFDLDGFTGFSRKTPDKLPPPKATRLGPIKAVKKTRSFKDVISNRFTPRGNKHSKPGTKMQFSSPYLK